MRLTPLDIRHKEFSRSMRGYKDLDVDEFLDDIADEFERVFNENIDHKEKLEALEDKIEQYRNIEDTLKKTLLSAQQQAEEMKQNAKKEADLILRDAELKSRSIINDSYAERQKVQRSVSALKQKNEELRYQLRAVIESYSNILDQEEIEPLEDEELGLGSEQAEAMAAASAGAAVAGSDPAGETAADPADSRTDRSISAEDTMIAGIDDAVSRELLFGDSKADDPAPAAIRHDDEEDPFADVEIDADERKFNW